MDAGFDEQLAYTRKLVSFASQRGEEFAIQDFIFNDFAARGLKMDRFDMDEATLTAHEGGAAVSASHSRVPIVVGIHHPQQETGRSLVLQHHLDVVPVGPRDMREHDPYAGAIVGNRMYGPGAGDMKAGAAANVFALEALRRIGPATGGDWRSSVPAWCRFQVRVAMALFIADWCGTEPLAA